ncbi:MAG TPA: beta-propeller domain-containing protein [Acidobacteriota bacterium]|nr:beta-propeller domain-containing protein [Acidobacteriota bacterium]
MQKEIKKRIYTYGIVAVLLAMVLGALCYNFGITPFSFTQNTFLKTFTSNEELRSYLTRNSQNQGWTPYLGPLDIRVLPTIVPSAASEVEASQSLRVYSTTNVQVAGVDEADVVKNDGENIYLISNSNILILKAYPPNEATVLSKISFNSSYLAGIFISKDSNRLVVLGSTYNTQESMLQGGYYPIFLDVKTFINVYDISDKAKPAFLTNFTISGSYFSSRMIGDYVYFVVSQGAYIIYDTVILPKIYSKNGIEEIGANEIYYSDASDDYYAYTTIVAINVKNTAEEPTSKTIMMAGTSSMYVSSNNIYITFPEADGQTAICRVHMENNAISPEAKGDVLGREINQFSMDEFNGYFRIATTTRINGTTQNNLYVLNTNLTIVGGLEDIAPGEAIDSARFIGDRCYLATSVVRRDPFFVIDVKNATEPKILGYLKIPGFTRYLHPYDEDHVIGVGRDENNHVRISLFDVTNVSAPIAMSNYTVEGDWSDTAVLTEHKAFLFDKSKYLLVIPLTISTYDEVTYSSHTWQGVYVFNVTLSGLALRGNVTHQDDSVSYWDSNYWINRALYIDNVLYTISSSKIKMNDLETLALMNEIELP